MQVPNLTPVRSRPWASIWRADAADGVWWLKVGSAATGYEPRLLRLLRDLWPGLVPEVAIHPDQPWALVADAGRPVRELLAPGPAATAFWCGLLADYAELQQAVPVAALRAVGVPDATPAALPGMAQQLLAEPAWLEPEYAPELTAADRRRIADCAPALREAAGALADGLPPTLQHDDLHGSNVFRRADRTAVIDWGDACLAHPFGTLLVTLRALGADWGLPADAAPLARVRAAYLEVWRTRGESTAELERQLDLALRTGCLARAASWRRALGTPGAGSELGLAGGVAHWLLLAARALEPGGRGVGELL